MGPMPPKTADGARAASEASEAASEGSAPPTDASAPAVANSTSSSTPTKTTKKAKCTTGKTEKKGKGKGKDAAAPPEETHRCFHCQSESAKMMCCSQCHRAWYCGKPCQKKHWKLHKRACVAAVAAAFDGTHNGHSRTVGSHVGHRGQGGPLTALVPPQPLAQ